MPRVNYREATDLLGHIDAEFVGCQMGFSDKDNWLQMRFCPWWMDPFFAKKPELKHEEGIQLVTVLPKTVIAFHLSYEEEVIDWDITNEHPLLWPYEQSVQVFLNDQLTVDQLLDLIEDVQSRLSGYARQADLMQYFNILKLRQWGLKAPFSLGRFPRSLFMIVRDVLKDRQIDYCAPHEPDLVELPVVCLFDQGDYIIAKDFEIEAAVVRKEG